MRDFVYEKTDHYKMAIAKSPIQGGEGGEETYEALDPDIIYNAMQEDGEDNVYVITDNMATAMQEDGEDNTYVVPDYIMQGDGMREDTYEALEDIAYTADRGGGVRESGLYAEPDNPGATTSLRVKYELH